MKCILDKFYKNSLYHPLMNTSNLKTEIVWLRKLRWGWLWRIYCTFKAICLKHKQHRQHEKASTEETPEMFPDTEVCVEKVQLDVSVEELSERNTTLIKDQCCISAVGSLQPPTQSNPDCTPAQLRITWKPDPKSQYLSFIKYTISSTSDHSWRKTVWKTCNKTLKNVF